MKTREIKFRVWDKEKQELTIKPHLGAGSASLLIAIGLDGNITLHNAYGLLDGSDVTKLHNDRFILNQFTGLQDKNGKDIYEGDVYHLGDPNITYKVIFKNGCFIGNQIGNKSLAGLEYWLDRIEIIGNIHQNPELLNDKP